MLSSAQGKAGKLENVKEAKRRAATRYAFRSVSLSMKAASATIISARAVAGAGLDFRRLDGCSGDMIHSACSAYKEAQMAVRIYNPLQSYGLSSYHVDCFI